MRTLLLIIAGLVATSAAAAAATTNEDEGLASVVLDLTRTVARLEARLESAIARLDTRLDGIDSSLGSSRTWLQHATVDAGVRGVPHDVPKHLCRVAAADVVGVQL